MDKRLIAKRIVQSTTRGVIVLDKNLSNLKESLNDKNIHVITIPQKTKKDEIKKLYLTRRILITNNPQKFIYDASAYEYGIISIKKLKYKNKDFIISIINKILSKYRLFSKYHGFIIEPDEKGRGKIKNLID